MSAKTLLARFNRSCASCLALLLLAASPGTFAQSGSPARAAGPTPGAAAGYLRSLTAIAFVKRGNGPEAPAKVGDLITSGTTIRGTAGSEIVLLFADGQGVTLSGDSELRIDTVRFAPGNPAASAMTVTLLRGTMRVVTGAIYAQNAASVQIRVGGSTIQGISKDLVAFVVQAEPGAQGRVSVATIVGEVEVRATSGQNLRIGADRFARWQGGSPFTPPIPLAAAPAVFQAIVIASRANVQEASTPIDVQSAAVQAALAVSQAGARGTGATINAEPLSGQLNMVIGTVFLRDANGVEKPAKIGDVFGTGTVVRTGSGSQAGLVFAEGEYAALGADSVFRVGAQPSDQGNARIQNAPMGLLSGRMSFVTWATPLSSQAAIRVAAGDGVIGVLGDGVAAFVVEVDSRNTANPASLAVTAGEVSLQAPTGAQIAIASGQYVTWAAAGVGAVVALAQAPSQFQNAFSETIANAPRNAEVAAELAGLPPTGAGQSPGTPASQTATQSAQAVQAQQPVQPQPVQAVGPVVIAIVIIPAVSPGGGRGCVGSPC